jgi:hypothetical protein
MCGPTRDSGPAPPSSTALLKISLYKTIHDQFPEVPASGLEDRAGRGWLFLDGTTYEPLFFNNSVPGEARWDPVNPNLMNYVSTSCEFGTWNPRTSATTVRKTVSGYSGCTMGGTGNWSDNSTRGGSQGYTNRR